MGYTTLKLLRQAVRRDARIADIPQTNVFDYDIDEWLNEAQNKLVEAGKFLTAQFTTDLVAEEQDYTLDDTVFEILSVSLNGDPLTKKPLEEILDINPGWRGDATGTPVYWIPLGAGAFALYPNPSAGSTDGLACEAYILPDQMTAAVGPSVPATYREAIYKYAFYRLADLKGFSAEDAKGYFETTVVNLRERGQSLDGAPRMVRFIE